MIFCLTVMLQIDLGSARHLVPVATLELPTLLAIKQDSVGLSTKRISDRMDFLRKVLTRSMAALARPCLLSMEALARPANLPAPPCLAAVEEARQNCLLVEGLSLPQGAMYALRKGIAQTRCPRAHRSRSHPSPLARLTLLPLGEV